jgi:hypothetical protein
MDEKPPTDNDAAFEEARREASKVRFALNFLVILSAAASSIFLVYVLMRIIPRGGSDLANVDVPTSSARDKTGMLRGQVSSGKIEAAFELRDVDEAEGYREKYSDQLRDALGVENPGRLYAFSVRNLSKTEGLDFSGGTLTLQEKGGAEYVASWLATVAHPKTPLGRMALTQSQAKFLLSPGERRELYVFVAAKGALPPAAADLTGGSIEAPGLPKVALSRAEVPIGR